MIREVFLQQNAFSDDDAFCSLEKGGALLDALVEFYESARKVLDEGITLNRILELPARENIARLREESNENIIARQKVVMEEMRAALADLTSRKG
ncbi:MAG: V-type ATP synthase subunit A, partial [Candidatus Hydrogenedentes bacterium]|nr:V-type ATP synthase subunit A [Candidatus Hydrogenedentota bacterium]